VTLAMPVKPRLARLMEETRGLSSDEFVRLLEHDRPARASDLASIQDLAAELGVAVRTLRRWNKRSDAPKRFRQSRRLMYRRADVQHWFARSKGTPGAGHDARDDGSP
jgi:Helix-turn-helix domain